MANIRKPKFKVGQLVRFPLSDVRTQRAREAGIILSIERAYELKDKFKTYYPDGTCRGELTTIKELSKGKFKGYAYTAKTIQPEEFIGEIVTVEEYKLTLSTKKEVIESYLNYKL